MHSRHHRKHHDDFINRRHVFSLLSSRKLYRSLVTVSTKNSGKTEMILLLGKRKRKKTPEKSPLELHQKCQNIMHKVKYCKSLLNTPPQDDYLITLNTMHVISIHLLSLRPTKRATISAQSEQKKRARFVIILWSNMQTRIEY